MQSTSYSIRIQNNEKECNAVVDLIRFSNFSSLNIKVMEKLIKNRIVNNIINYHHLSRNQIEPTKMKE